MPSVNSRSIPKVWPSSTFTTPSLPTLSMASAMTLPISSERAEMAPTREISSRPEISCDWPWTASPAAATGAARGAAAPARALPAARDLLRLALDGLDGGGDGLVDAAPEDHRVRAGGHV